MNIINKETTIRETGQKVSKPIYNITNPVDKAGNGLPRPLMFVHQLVLHSRQWHQPLKTIYLSPGWYTIVFDWVRRRATEEEAECKVDLLTFDGANIEMMEENHIIRAKNGTDEIDWDYYPTKVD